jgi:hypothetical protein
MVVPGRVALPLDHDKALILRGGLEAIGGVFMMPPLAVVLSLPSVPLLIVKSSSPSNRILPQFVGSVSLEYEMALFRQTPIQNPAQIKHTSSYTRHVSVHVDISLDFMSVSRRELQQSPSQSAESSWRRRSSSFHCFISKMKIDPLLTRNQAHHFHVTPCKTNHR